MAVRAIATTSGVSRILYKEVLDSVCAKNFTTMPTLIDHAPQRKCTCSQWCCNRIVGVVYFLVCSIKTLSVPNP